MPGQNVNAFYNIPKEQVKFFTETHEAVDALYHNGLRATIGKSAGSVEGNGFSRQRRRREGEEVNLPSSRAKNIDKLLELQAKRQEARSANDLAAYLKIDGEIESFTESELDTIKQLQGFLERHVERKAATNKHDNVL